MTDKNELSRVAESVAWAHDTKGDAYVISDAVKQLWLKAKPRHVEHYTIPLYTHPPEPARDAKDDRIAELEAANVGLADESVRLQEALRFYAEHKHMLGFDRWDSASGEAGNWLCDPSHSPAMVEDGWVAREALAPIDAPIKAAMAQESGE